MAHHIAWTIDPGWRVCAAFTCDEPDTANCRKGCGGENCEAWGYCGGSCGRCLTGQPVADEHCSNCGTPILSTGGCNALPWLEEGDPAELYDGPPHPPVDGPIVVEWSVRDEGYLWHYASEGVES